MPEDFVSGRDAATAGSPRYDWSDPVTHDGIFGERIPMFTSWLGLKTLDRPLLFRL